MAELLKVLYMIIVVLLSLSCLSSIIGNIRRSVYPVSPEDRTEGLSGLATSIVCLLIFYGCCWATYTKLLYMQ